jgi:hypothetical protein
MLNTIDFFVEKYGIIDGNIRYKNKHKKLKVSKKSKIIGDILEDIKVSFISEEIIDGRQLTIYIPDLKIVIEYYGDYWQL